MHKAYILLTLLSISNFLSYSQEDESKLKDFIFFKPLGFVNLINPNLTAGYEFRINQKDALVLDIGVLTPKSAPGYFFQAAFPGPNGSWRNQGYLAALEYKHYWKETKSNKGEVYVSAQVKYIQNESQIERSFYGLNPNIDYYSEDVRVYGTAFYFGQQAVVYNQDYDIIRKRYFLGVNIGVLETDMNKISIDSYAGLGMYVQEVREFGRLEPTDPGYDLSGLFTQAGLRYYPMLNVGLKFGFKTW